MPPEKIGRYQIKCELGRGGMATVFQAYDPSFERDVAVKVLPPNFLNEPQLRIRFEREAKMIASLEHPAIVPVYDFGEQDGQPYIVMRYMAGGSMADRLKRGAIVLEETASIISRLAPALDAAHSRGIVHRDIKPGNVLFDQYGNAFLSDFGIARLGEAGGTTITGESILGTPAYMSPEQIQADKAIDGRSDIYAMGVLIFQMLTGQAPYQADTPAKVMLMHILEPVPNILNRKADLPSGCETIIAQAMAKKPEDRFKSTAELASAMDRVIHNPQLARPSSTEERTVFSGQTVVSKPKTPIPQQLEPVPSIAYSTPVLQTGGTAQRAVPASPLAASPRSSKRFPTLAISLLVLMLGGVLLVGGFIFLNGRGGLAARVSGSKSSLNPAETQAGAPLPAVASVTEPPVAVLLPTFTKVPDTLPPTPAPASLLASSSSTAKPTGEPENNSAPSPTAGVLIEPATTKIPPGGATEEAALQVTSAATEILPVSSGLMLGGSDHIAYINNGDIWTANLDGTELKQLTSDGKEKTGLQWTPDGQKIVYMNGKCAYSVDFANGQVETIVCFNFVEYFEAFEISPTGKQAAVTLDHQLYIVPYDLEILSKVRVRSDLTAMADCKDFAPYKKNFVKLAQWSKDGQRLAAVVLGVVGAGERADLVQIFDTNFCTPTPHVVDNFPYPRFNIKGYDKTPVIPHLAWDGSFLFVLNSIVRNDGFGDLYIYNTELHKAQTEINPVGSVCCYRDAHFSPDGSYLAFAFQNYLEGANSVTHIYYIGYGSLGTGGEYQPLPLPEITNPKEKPQPVLRPIPGEN